MSVAPLRILPLGGLGEVGMNVLALEQGGDAILIDCGVTFDDRGIGADVVHPDFSVLSRLNARVAAIVLTHGHEDHIGAIPYFLERFDVPIYGPKYALGLLRTRAKEHEVLSYARMIEIRTREPVRIGPFEIEPVRVTHSIADATALAIRTAQGTVVHSGDFKFDETPPDGEHFDIERFTELGDEGVSLFFSDSTNIDAPGVSGSEAGVGEALETLIADAPSAVVVALFASNVHRLRMLGEIAQRTKRRIVLLGRGVRTHADVARETGYLEWPSDLVARDARSMSPKRVLAIATGSQGETRAALSRLASGTHPDLKLSMDDRVILSSRVIPGHELEVSDLISALLRTGADVRSRGTDRGVHVSGHAHRDEQARFLTLVRPQHFIPVHGTIHHLTRHRALALEYGVPHSTVLENGDLAEFTRDQGIVIVEKKPVPRVHRFEKRVVTEEVLRARRLLAQHGVLSVYLAISGAAVHECVIRAIGVLPPGQTENSDLRAAICEAVLECQAKHPDQSTLVAKAEEAARMAARRWVHRDHGFKPEVIAVVRFQ